MRSAFVVGTAAVDVLYDALATRSVTDRDAVVPVLSCDAGIRGPIPCLSEVVGESFRFQFLRSSRGWSNAACVLKSVANMAAYDE